MFEDEKRGTRNCVEAMVVAGLSLGDILATREKLEEMHRHLQGCAQPIVTDKEIAALFVLHNFNGVDLSSPAAFDSFGKRISIVGSK